MVVDRADLGVSRLNRADGPGVNSGTTAGHTPSSRGNTANICAVMAHDSATMANDFIAKNLLSDAHAETPADDAQIATAYESPAANGDAPILADSPPFDIRRRAASVKQTRK